MIGTARLGYINEYSHYLFPKKKKQKIRYQRSACQENEKEQMMKRYINKKYAWSVEMLSFQI